MVLSQLHQKVKQGGISREEFREIKHEILFGDKTVESYVNEMLGMQLFMWYQDRLCTSIQKTAVEIRRQIQELDNEINKHDGWANYLTALAKVNALKWVLGEIENI